MALLNIYVENCKPCHNEIKENSRKLTWMYNMWADCISERSILYSLIHKERLSSAQNYTVYNYVHEHK